MRIVCAAAGGSIRWKRSSNTTKLSEPRENSAAPTGSTKGICKAMPFSPPGGRAMLATSATGPDGTVSRVTGQFWVDSGGEGSGRSVTRLSSGPVAGRPGDFIWPIPASARGVVASARGSPAASVAIGLRGGGPSAAARSGSDPTGSGRASFGSLDPGGGGSERGGTGAIVAFTLTGFRPGEPAPARFGPAGFALAESAIPGSDGANSGFGPTMLTTAEVSPFAAAVTG